MSGGSLSAGWQHQGLSFLPGFANFAEGGKSELHRARCRVTKAPALCRRGLRAYTGGIAARHLGGKCHRKQTVRIYSDKGEKVG